jgi:hypothetical protein
MVVLGMACQPGLPRRHRKWKTNLIAKKKTTRYAITKPNLFHSRLDSGHHAQQAYPASRAFGATIKTCNHPGQSEYGMTTSLIIVLLLLGRFTGHRDSCTQQHQYHSPENADHCGHEEVQTLDLIKERVSDEKDQRSQVPASNMARP